MRRWGRLAAGILVATLIVAAACRRHAETPRIAYVFPGERSSIRVAAVAQSMIDAWRPARVAEVVIPKLASQQPSDLSQNVEYADRALGAGAVAAAGHLSSRSSLLVAPMYIQAHVPLVVPTGTSRRLGQMGEWVFPLASNEDAEGEFLVAYATERLGLKRLTVVYVSADEYGTGLRDAVVTAMRKRSLSPVEQVGVLDDSDHERLLAASFQRARPDGLIVATRPRSLRLVLQSLRAQKLELPVLAGDGVVLTPSFIGTIADLSANLYVAAFWHPDLDRQESREFLKAYHREAGWPVPSSTDAMFFDSLTLLGAAIRDAGADPAGIRRYLAALGVSSPPFAGATGPISFQLNRPINMVMTQVRDGASALVKGR